MNFAVFLGRANTFWASWVQRVMSQALYFFGLFIVIVVTCAKSPLSVLDCLRIVGGTWLVVEESTKDEEGLADEARHLWDRQLFLEIEYIFSANISNILHFAMRIGWFDKPRHSQKESISAAHPHPLEGACHPEPGLLLLVISSNLLNTSTV